MKNYPAIAHSPLSSREGAHCSATQSSAGEGDVSPPEGFA